jgi:hypothetical protein
VPRQEILILTPKQATQPDAKPAEPKPDAKEPEPTADPKATVTKSEAKVAVPQSDDKSSDLTAQIAKRAYELYEAGGRQKDHAAQDWEQASREIRKDGPKSDTNVVEPKIAVKAAEPKPDTKATENNPKAKAKTPTDLTPQLVKKVHELYEELGREEVRVVEELETAQKEGRKDGN